MTKKIFKIDNVYFCITSLLFFFIRVFLETPQVNCGPESMEIIAKTAENFEGILFIKNQRRTKGCFQVYEKLSSTNMSKKPTFSIPLKEITNCGIELKKNVSNFLKTKSHKKKYLICFVL